MNDFNDIWDAITENEPSSPAACACTIHLSHREAEYDASECVIAEGVAEAIAHGHPDWSHATAYGPCTIPTTTNQ